MESMLPGGLDVIFTSDWDGPFDGLELNLEDLGEFAAYQGWQMPIASGNNYWDRPLTHGEVGCTLSHLHCWEDARRTVPGDPILVLEDDVVLPADFVDQMIGLIADVERLDTNWGLIYLGRSKQGHDVEVAEGLVRPGFSYGSYAYVLSGSAVVDFVQAGLGRAIIPVDEFLPATFVEHPRPDIRMLYPPRVTAFAPVPVLVRHDGGGISDSEAEVST